MSTFHRRYVPGRTHFFTARLQNPASDLLVSQIDLLRDATRLSMKRWPFEIAAAVILPNQLHMIWILPEQDPDFSIRWRLVKSTFSRHVPRPDDVAPGRGEKGIWQRRFWHHAIRDVGDYDRHMHVIATAPVQSGLVRRAADWPYSSLSSRNGDRDQRPARTIAPVPSSRDPSIAARAS